MKANQRCGSLGSSFTSDAILFLSQKRALFIQCWIDKSSLKGLDASASRSSGLILQTVVYMQGFPFEGFHMEDVMLPEDDDMGIPSDDDEEDEEEIQTETGFGSVVGEDFAT